MIDAAECFLDTGILLYAATGRVDEPEKHAAAQALLPLKFGTSGQVLSEFYSCATAGGSADGRGPLTAEEARLWVVALTKKPFLAVDEALVRAAIDVSTRFGIDFWNASNLAAAERLGATTLYSEHLDHGRSYGTVTALNPFLD